jgi:predicted nuclease with TOPRIM domain
LKSDLSDVDRELSKVQAEKDMILKKMGVVAAKFQPFKEQLRREELELTKLTEEKHKRENELRHEQK